MKSKISTSNIAPLLQRFFLDRLVEQRRASPQTVASYRDAFRLLLKYAHKSKSIDPAALTLGCIDAAFVLDFLKYLEVERKSSARSRNVRLAAIRSFVRYASFEEPTYVETARRVLAIPMKRFNRPLLGFLTRDETTALLAAPDAVTWSGRRDRAMLAALYNTGARVSEIVTLRIEDVSASGVAAIHIRGKGRKDRLVPLWNQTRSLLRKWIASQRGAPKDPLFPNRKGEFMSRSGIESRLRAAVKQASRLCPTIKNRRISPHTLRHTTAMHLLQSGVDITVIALWLGHENPGTTHHYVEADIAMKERALRKLQPPNVKELRFKPGDSLLAFLDTL